MKINSLKIKFRLKAKHTKKIIHSLKVLSWFLTGALLALFFVSSFGFFAYRIIYKNNIYPAFMLMELILGEKANQRSTNFLSIGIL